MKSPLVPARRGKVVCLVLTLLMAAGCTHIPPAELQATATDYIVDTGSLSMIQTSNQSRL